jgi:hypothetical protein
MWNWANNLLASDARSRHYYQPPTGAGRLTSGIGICMADQIKNHRYLADSTRAILRDYIAGDEAEKIAKSLETLNTTLPAVVTVAGRPGQLRAADQQISWGITRRDGKYKVIVLSEGEDIDRAVKMLDEEYAAVFVKPVTHTFMTLHMTL